MGATSRVIARLRSDRGGISLPELILVSGMTIVIFAASLNFVQISASHQQGTGGRADALSQQRAGLERMTREVRQALTITASNPAIANIQKYAVGGASLIQVRFDCSAGSVCKRYEAPDGVTITSSHLTHDQLVSGVQSAVFTPSTIASASDYVTVELQVSSAGRTSPSVLSDGVHLRNKSI